MTTTEEPVDPAEQDSPGAPAQTVRVPNVSPNAKSGLDHTIIGSNALAPNDEEDGSDEEVAEDPVPQGDVDAAVAYVEAAEDSDTARERADAVWGAYKGDDDQANTDLAARLRAATGTGVNTEDATGGAAQGDQQEDDPAAGDGPVDPAAADLVTPPADPNATAADPNATDADET